MSEICNTCGLPKELCVCEAIAKEAQEIIVKTVKKKFENFIHTIQGMEAKDENLRQLAKELKSKFACGGTVKDGVIELQGDHKSKIKPFLVSKGFLPEMIQVK